MTKALKSIIVLSVIGAALAIVLGGVNAITSPAILEAEREKTAKALSEVYKTSDVFEKVDIAEISGLPESVTEAYSAADGGYVIKLTTTGYASGLVILCGISADGRVTGAVSIASNETLGYEKTYGEQLIGKNAVSIDNADTVSGATKTTAAYRDAVKDALIAASVIAD